MNKLTLPNFDGITRIVCLDIGDGECSAFTCIIENGIMAKKTEPLYFKIGKNDSKKTMPSVISYKRNSETGNLELVSIGNLQASKGNENYVSVANFKRNPINNENDKQEINWTGKHKAFRSYKKNSRFDFAEEADEEDIAVVENDTDVRVYRKEEEKTYKECMRDFIGCLWENLKKNNSNDAEILPKNPKNEETMIFAACPSSRVWMDHRDQYAKLISDATGIGQKNIHIFRESDVAAYRALKNEDESLTLDHGVVVIDCGSSTLDFTYMKQGEIKEAFSWTLGAGMIERLMFEKMKTILEKSDKPNERELLKYLETGKNRDYYLFSIRKDAKEDYFSPKEEGKKTNETAKYYLEDANKELGKDFYIDDTFMNDVLSMPIGDEVMCGGKHALSESSWEFGWEQCFKAFLKTCETKLDGSQIDRIVLTGGASGMYFIKELCEKFFEGVDIDLDPHPYSCVSFGLSRLAYNMFNVEKVIRNEASRFKDDDFRDVIEACEKIGKKIDSYLITKRDEAINNLIKRYEKVDFEGYYESVTLQKEINSELNRLVSKRGIEKAVENEAKEFISVLNKRLQEASDRCSDELYRRDSVGSIRVDDTEIFGKYEDEKSPIFPDDRCYSDFSIYDRLSWSEKSKRKKIYVNKLYTSTKNPSTNAVGLFPTEFSLVGWAIKKWSESQQVKFEAVRSVAKLSDFQYDADIRQHTPRILKAINIPIPGYSYSNYFEPFKTVNVEFLCDVYFKCIKEMIMRVALLLDYECDMRPIFGKPSFD